MKLTIRHQIAIALPGGAAHAVQHLLLTPRTGPTQTVSGWKIEMPGIETAASFTDAYGNRAHLVAQHKPPEELLLVASGSVETHDRNGVLGRPLGEPVPALFLRVTPLTQPNKEILSGFDSGRRDRIALLHELMIRTGEVLAPLRQQELQEQEQSQEQSQGGQSQSQSQGQTSAPEPEAVVAPDASASEMAHGFIGAARALSIPARYVTGYLTGDEDGPAALHAWAEALDDSIGWIAFDPMLQLCPTERHVRIAIGLDAVSAAPMRSVPTTEAPAPAELSVEIAE